MQIVYCNLPLLCRDSLGDIGFHQIFEALFRCVQIERTSYINSSKSSISSIAANRLRDCATIFRLAVELGVRIVTSKTANAVIDHVVDTLPVAGEAYCQPLTDDYLKILRTMLERAAHVEHLRKKKWSVVVEFLIQGISHYALEDETPSSGTNSSILSQSSRNGRTTSLRFSQSSVSRPARHDGGRPTEDLFICLERLTAATNAPIMSEANLIVDSIIGFLNSSASGGILHQLAFSCVNNTLSRIIKENSKLAQKVVLEVLPTIRRLWSTKNLLLRDEMLITLLLSKDIIESLPKTNHSHDVYSSLSNLVEVLSAEYSRRNERDVLQLDEIVFDTDHTPKVMSLDNFRVRAEHTRGTFNWAAINVLAFTTITIDHFPKMAEEDGTNDAPSKRRKLASGIDEVFRHSLSGFSMVKVRALQTVPFLLYHWPDLADRLLHFIVQFTNQILDEDTAIASWTMIALSRHD